MKFATLFSGGELFGIGARQAGLEHSFGIELDPDIADVARLNNFHILTQDVRQYLFSDSSQPHVDNLFLLHASPPCQNASLANGNGKNETDVDFELAGATLMAVKALQPAFFTLENVVNYRNFNSFKFIVKELKRFGYRLGYWGLNFADYGVPQTRKRLILIARRNGRGVVKPFPSYARHYDMFSLPWIGWYEAIAIRKNLLFSLQSCTFSGFQIENLRRSGIDLARPGSFLADVRHSKRKGTVRLLHEPSFTIVASQSKGHSKGRLPCGKIFRANQAVYAALQAIPTTYVFGKSSLVNQKIIGNGIPPLFAEKLVRHLISLM